MPDNKDIGKRIFINGIYIDPNIPYNDKKTYICAPQGGMYTADEKLGVPLIATHGMVVIYDNQHMAYKSIAFASIFDKEGKTYPAFKPVLAPCDGTLRLVKGKPAMDIKYGLLMFEGLANYKLKSYKKGQVMGEVSPIYHLNNCEGIMMTCYKEIDGEVFYLPSVYYNIPWYE